MKFFIKMFFVVVSLCGALLNAAAIAGAGAEKKVVFFNACNETSAKYCDEIGIVAKGIEFAVTDAGKGAADAWFNEICASKPLLKNGAQRRYLVYVQRGKITDVHSEVTKVYCECNHSEGIPADIWNLLKECKEAAPLFVVVKPMVVFRCDSMRQIAAAAYVADQVGKHKYMQEGAVSTSMTVELPYSESSRSSRDE